jgi:hypothetical protein
MRTPGVEEMIMNALARFARAREGKYVLFSTGRAFLYIL